MKDGNKFSTSLSQELDIIIFLFFLGLALLRFCTES